MALIYSRAVICTNKLCDYTGTITLIDKSHLREKEVCPKCGFKTLAENPVMSGAELALAMAEALRGLGGRIVR